MGIENDDIDILIKNTEDLAHRLVGFGFKLPRNFTPISTGAFGFKEYINIKYEEFKDRKLEGAPDDLIKIYDDRLKLEYNRIKKKGFEWYFKIEANFVKRAKEKWHPCRYCQGISRRLIDSLCPWDYSA